MWKDGRVWNSFPGGLLTLANYSDVPAAYPWKHSPPPSWNQISNPSPKFTALIYTQQASGLTPGSGGGAPLLRLLRTVARSPHVAKVTDIFSFFCASITVTTCSARRLLSWHARRYGGTLLILFVSFRFSSCGPANHPNLPRPAGRPSCRAFRFTSSFPAAERTLASDSGD